MCIGNNLSVHSCCFSCSSWLAHTPDNSFLGFIIDVDTQEGEKLDKLNQAVVYGKELYMWKVCVQMLFKWDIFAFRLLDPRT